jgi:hypothetical protein
MVKHESFYLTVASEKGYFMYILFIYYMPYYMFIILPYVVCLLYLLLYYIILLYVVCLLYVYYTSVCSMCIMSII